MQNSIKSILNSGSSGFVIDIECNLSNGLPSIIIVGLGNKAIDEAKERIRSAFAHSKLNFPKKRITINLAPADIPKDSAAFDLPISAAILCAGGQVSRAVRPTEAFIGELGLDGSVRAVRGIIGKLVTGKLKGITTFYIPHSNLEQALLVPDISIIAVHSLNDLYRHLAGQNILPITKASLPQNLVAKVLPDVIGDIAGQTQAKRALEIAAAGGHNVFLSGPPGTGKSMLAKALPYLLPPLTVEDMLEITHLHSLASNDYEQLVTERPFRTPHHTASQVAIIGGGANLKPGEISLSHRGILFLDEMPEFSRSTLEALRQPLEDGVITVSRARDSVLFPANFILVATANPCPCGYFGTSKICECSPRQILQYRQKISGPIMDRIDLHVTVENVEHTQLLRANTHESAQPMMRKNIDMARATQQKRYKSSQKLNAAMSNKDIKTIAAISPEAELLLNQAAERLAISARSYMRIIKVARTIADLAQSAIIKEEHITEALQYRPQNHATIN